MRLSFLLFFSLLFSVFAMNALGLDPEPLIYDKALSQSISEQNNQVLIQGGHFRMGSSSGEADEQPEHQVWLHSFYMDVHEVTLAQYAQCPECKRGTGGFDTTDPQQPVVYVDWANAQRFCSFVGKRLPTEAEWEYVARAGSTGKYSFGENPNQLEDYAWYGNNTAALNTWYARRVQAKKSNAWGLYDLYGNVMEWVQDDYSSDYYGVSNPVYNPQGIMQKNSLDYPRKVVRGGAWEGGDANNLRSSKRFAFAPWVQSFQIGFRCASSVRKIGL